MKIKLKINKNKIKMYKFQIMKKINQLIINKLQEKLKVDLIKYLITCSYKCQMNSFKEIMQVEKY